MPGNTCRVFFAGTGATYEPEGDLDKTVVFSALDIIKEQIESHSQNNANNHTNNILKLLEEFDQGLDISLFDDLTRMIRVSGLESTVKEAFEKKGLVYPASIHNFASTSGTGHDIAYNGVAFYGGGMNAFGATRIGRMALEEIKQKFLQFQEENKDDPNARFTIEMGGWSRGAVTSYWVAKHLPSVLTPEQLAKVDVNLDLKDPVPGNLKGLGATKYGARFANLVADLSNCPWVKKVDVLIATVPNAYTTNIFGKLIQSFFSTIVPKLPKNTKLNLAVEPSQHGCSFNDIHQDSIPLEGKEKEIQNNVRSGITGGSFGKTLKFTQGASPFYNSKHYNITQEAREKFKNNEGEIRNFIIDKLNAHYNNGSGSGIDSESAKELANKYIEHSRKIDVPGWRPQFAFGSTRLYHDPQYSNVNAIAIDKENRTDFTPIYQRVMAYLDLASHRLQKDPNASKQIHDLQSKLESIAKNANPMTTNVEKIMALKTALQDSLSVKDSAIKRPLKYLLEDRDKLFEMKRVSIEIKESLSKGSNLKDSKEAAVLLKAMATLQKVNPSFFKPQVLVALNSLLKDKSTNADNFAQRLQTVLSHTKLKTENNVVKVWREKVLEHFKDPEKNSIKGLGKELEKAKTPSLKANQINFKERLPKAENKSEVEQKPNTNLKFN